MYDQNGRKGSTKAKLLLSSALTLSTSPLTAAISPEVIAKAWRDPAFFHSLDERTKEQIPQNPVGHVSTNWKRSTTSDDTVMGTTSSLCSTVDSTCSTVDSTCSTVSSLCNTADSTCSTVDSTCSTSDSSCSTVSSTCSTSDSACTAPSICNG